MVPVPCWADELAAEVVPKSFFVASSVFLYDVCFFGKVIFHNMYIVLFLYVDHVDADFFYDIFVFLYT